MTKKPHVIIGILAYNAEANIQQLISSLADQSQENFTLKKIIIRSDGSDDATVIKAQAVQSKYIQVIDAYERKGFAYGVETLIKTCTTDILILLNDDIQINDIYFIAKVVAPFVTNNSIGLVSGNPQPLPPRTFLEKAVISSFNAFKSMCYSFKGGSNAFGCDGKILAFSKKFRESLQFPAELKDMGCVDAFLYCSCLHNGFIFKHAKQAKVLFRLPSTQQDYLRLNIRNNTNVHLLKKTFGDLVDREYKKPMIGYAFMLFETLKNPIGCIYLFLLGLYSHFQARRNYQNFDTTWEPVKTTKELT